MILCLVRQRGQGPQRAIRVQEPACGDVTRMSPNNNFKNKQLKFTSLAIYGLSKRSRAFLRLQLVKVWSNPHIGNCLESSRIVSFVCAPMMTLTGLMRPC